MTLVLDIHVILATSGAIRQDSVDDTRSQQIIKDFTHVMGKRSPAEPNMVTKTICDLNAVGSLG